MYIFFMKKPRCIKRVIRDSTSKLGLTSVQNFQNNLQTKYEDQVFYLLSILRTYDLSEACVQGTLLKNVSLYTRVKDSEIGL